MISLLNEFLRGLSIFCCIFHRFVDSISTPWRSLESCFDPRFLGSTRIVRFQLSKRHFRWKKQMVVPSRLVQLLFLSNFWCLVWGGSIFNSRKVKVLAGDLRTAQFGLNQVKSGVGISRKAGTAFSFLVYPRE